MFRYEFWFGNIRDVASENLKKLIQVTTPVDALSYVKGIDPREPKVVGVYKREESDDSEVSDFIVEAKLVKPVRFRKFLCPFLTQVGHFYTAEGARTAKSRIQSDIMLSTKTAEDIERIRVCNIYDLNVKDAYGGLEGLFKMREDFEAKGVDSEFFDYIKEEGLLKKVVGILQNARKECGLTQMEDYLLKHLQE